MARAAFLMSQPIGWPALISVSATIIVGWIRIGKVVDIFNFVVQFNWCFQGFGIGFILGLLRNKVKNKIALN